MEFKPKGLLIDATGVLYNSVSGGDGEPIEGSAEAIKILKEKEIPFRILSNASTKPTTELEAKLNRLHLGLPVGSVIGPVPATISFLRENDLRPAVFVNKGLEESFRFFKTMEEPNAILLSFLDGDFTNENLNTMLDLLLKMEIPRLVSIGNSSSFKRTEGQCLDVGTYAAILKFAVPGLVHDIIGKPSPDYFQYGLDSLDLSKSEIIMIGDDPKSDVTGAKNFGLKAVQVRTGKYNSAIGDSKDATFVEDNLLAVVKRLYG